MINLKTQKSTTDAGYFEKNFPKLMAFRHKDYMWGRIAIAAAGTVLALYFSVDAFFFHNSDGGLVDYIKAVGIIFLITVLRKTILRLLEAADKTNVVQFVEPPHNPEESTWVRFGFWLPFGQRRGLNGFIARTTEGFFVMLMLFALIGKCARAGIIVLPAFVPIAFSRVTFPVESWLALGIVEIALVISWINNSIFLMRYAKVRGAVAGTIGKFLGGKSPLKAIGLELFEYFQFRKTENPDCCKEEMAAEAAAMIVLSLYEKNKEPLGEYQEMMHSALVAELVRHDYDVGSVPALMKFLDMKLDELKKKEK